MNRREFLQHSATLTLAAAAPSGLLAQRQPHVPKPPPAPLSGTTPPVLQAMTETGVTVFWSASGPATGWVEYGETPELGMVARGEVDGLLPYDERVLRVRLSNLKPGRTYHYRVQTAAFDFTHPYSVGRGGGQPSPVYTFRTFDHRANETNFVVWNDTHENKETLAKLVEHLGKYPADFLFWNGDVFNFIASEDSLIGETLHPAGLEYAASRPVLLNRGNHDVRGNHARRIGRTWEAPNGKYYHQFRQGPVAFLALDTGEDKDDSHQEYGGLTNFAGYRSEQVPWIQAAIARDEFRSAPFRVLFTHIPLRGAGESKDSRAKWEPLLRNAGIDLAISGHTHRYRHDDATTEQPWPLLVGGGPALSAATFIHVRATTDELHYRLFGADARSLGEWSAKRRA